MSSLKAYRHRLKGPAKILSVFLLLFVLYIRSPKNDRQPPDHCLLIGTDPSRPFLWQPNTRTLCLQQDVCVNPKFFLRLRETEATCTVLTSNLTPHEITPERFALEFSSCEAFRRSRITCAHGTGLYQNMPQCPQEGLCNGSGAQWIANALIVPNYPFPANIYHYANVLTYIAFVLSNIHKLHSKSISRMTVVMRGQPNEYGWQRGLLAALHTHMFQSLPFAVEFIYLSDVNTTLCVKHAVTLGLRGHVNVWPFVNDSKVPLNGLSVPIEAVTVKDSVLQAAGLSGVWATSGKMRLPPLVIGYAKRLRLEQGHNIDATVRPGGMKRQFSKEDEVWFVRMTQDVAEEYGVELREFVTGPTESFEEQVRKAAGIGVLIGIHGANLVNGLFMHSFGALIEIQPYGIRSPCYMAGGNSGLAYWGIDGARKDVFDCDTRNMQCRLRYRQSEIFLEAEQRDNITMSLRQAVQHVLRLHQKWEEGISVRAEKGRYILND